MANLKKATKAFQSVLNSTNKNVDVDKIPMRNKAIEKLMSQAKNNDYSKTKKTTGIKGLSKLNPIKGTLGKIQPPKPTET